MSGRLPRALAWLALAGILACGGPASGPATPNLLVIMLDTARADRFGFMGHSRPTSPRTDAFAAGSLVFERHYANSSHTKPSVGTLFTGLHARSHGAVERVTGRLDESRLTLAERLSGAGYATAAIVGNVVVSEPFGFAQGFDAFEFVASRSGEAIAGSAIDWLRDPPQPFFLYLHFMDPHAPYEVEAGAPAGWLDPGYAGPVSGATEELHAILQGRARADAADRARIDALYDLQIRQFDARFGRVLDALDAAGLADHTVVVLVADHGEELFEHGSVLHGVTLYEEQLRVPLVIRDPESTGRRIGRRTRQVDVLPTLLERLGLPAEGLQGESLAGWLRGEEPGAGDPAVLAETGLRGLKRVKLRALVDGRWKLVENQVPRRRFELYDLESDPGERHDLARSEPEQLARMRARLDALLAALPDASTGGREPTASEREQLRALGYVE